MGKPFGCELILDLQGCDSRRFRRHHIERYMVELCDHIGMKRADLHFWDYDGNPELKEAAPDDLAGTSAVQFIQTSSITIHALDRLRAIYVNIFSCRDFEARFAADFTAKFFRADSFTFNYVSRG